MAFEAEITEFESNLRRILVIGERAVHQQATPAEIAEFLALDEVHDAFFALIEARKDELTLEQAERIAQCGVTFNEVTKMQWAEKNGTEFTKGI